MEATQRQHNITTKLNKIDVGDGSPDDCITDTTSSKIVNRSRSQVRSILDENKIVFISVLMRDLHNSIIEVFPHLRLT